MIYIYIYIYIRVVYSFTYHNQIVCIQTVRTERKASHMPASLNPEHFHATFPSGQARTCQAERDAYRCVRDAGTSDVGEQARDRNAKTGNRAIEVCESAGYVCTYVYLSIYLSIYLSLSLSIYIYIDIHTHDHPESIL